MKNFEMRGATNTDGVDTNYMDFYLDHVNVARWDMGMIFVFDNPQVSRVEQNVKTLVDAVQFLCKYFDLR